MVGLLIVPDAGYAVSAASEVAVKVAKSTVEPLPVAVTWLKRLFHHRPVAVRRQETLADEVMLNRLENGWWGKTITEVILAPYQFSGWNTNDPNRIKAMLLDDSDTKYQECVKAWATAKSGTGFAKGALYYFNPKVVKAPAWATPQRFVATVGNHKFYSA